MAEVVSLEAKLTDHWQRHLAHCEEGVRLAEYNLGRLAVIYSDQLQFDLVNGDKR